MTAAQDKFWPISDFYLLAKIQINLNLREKNYRSQEKLNIGFIIKFTKGLSLLHHSWKILIPGSRSTSANSLAHQPKMMEKLVPQFKVQIEKVGTQYGT